MALTITARGTAVNGTPGVSSLAVTVGAVVSANDGYLVLVAFKNSNSVTSISDQAGNTGVFLGSKANSTTDEWVEVWLVTCASQLSATQTTTVNFAGSTLDTCVGTVQIAGVTSGATLVQAAESAVRTQEATGNGFGSVSYSGLASRNRLWLMAGGKAANTTTGLTASTNFTSAGWTIRSRNNAAACILRSEWRLNTSTGETSNPTLAVTGDTASVFVAIEQVTLKSLNATESALASPAKRVGASRFATGSVAQFMVKTAHAGVAATSAAAVFITRIINQTRFATAAANATLAANTAKTATLLAIQASVVTLTKVASPIVLAAGQAVSAFVLKNVSATTVVAADAAASLGKSVATILHAFSSAYASAAGAKTSTSGTTSYVDLGAVQRIESGSPSARTSYVDLGAAQRPESGGGATTNQALYAVEAAAVVTAKVVGAVKRATSAPSLAVTRALSRLSTVAATATAVALKQVDVLKTAAAASAAALNAIKVFLQTLLTTASAAVSQSRLVQVSHLVSTAASLLLSIAASAHTYAVSAASAASVFLTKQVNTAVRATSAASGALSAVIYLPGLFASAAARATQQKAAQVTHVVGEAASALLSIAVSAHTVALSAASAASAFVTKQVNRTRAVAAGSAATLNALKVFLQSLLTTSAASAVLVRTTQAVRLATSSAAAVRQAAVSVSHAAASRTSALAQKQAQVLHVAASRTAASLGAIKVLLKALLAISAATAAIARTVQVTHVVASAAAAVQARAVSATHVAAEAASVLRIATVSLLHATSGRSAAVQQRQAQPTLTASSATSIALARFISVTRVVTQAARALVAAFSGAVHTPRIIAMTASADGVAQSFTASVSTYTFLASE